MANVELDDTIKDKLKDSFKVSETDIQSLLDFFNSTLKPAKNVFEGKGGYCG